MSQGGERATVAVMLAGFWVAYFFGVFGDIPWWVIAIVSSVMALHVTATQWFHRTFDVRHDIDATWWEWIGAGMAFALIFLGGVWYRDLREGFYVFITAIGWMFLFVAFWVVRRARRKR